MTTPEKIPVEVFSLGEFLAEEILARGCKSEHLAAAMKTPGGFGLDLFRLDLILTIQNEKLILDDEIYEGLARAFGVHADTFRNIHAAWNAAPPERRSKFDCPDDVFGPVSLRACMRVVHPEPK